MAGELAENVAPGRQYVPLLTENYQAYMMFKDIDFVTISSNNHASPTGALPFLLPASSSNNPGEAVLPVPSTRIERWIRERNLGQETMGRPSDEVRDEENQRAEAGASTKQKSNSKESLDMRYEAYMSLLNHRIRNAYVSLPFLHQVISNIHVA